MLILPIDVMRTWSSSTHLRSSRAMAGTAAAAVLLQLLASSVAYAAIFPDVPEGHMYRNEVETLVGAQVINGNPDGNFSPERAVNRAEMLKMLYKARGRVPDPTSRGCFPDVAQESWYEEFVCDAAAQGYVQGYADGNFRPANNVNRVEALKMITQVFALPVEEMTEEHRDIVNFVDVSVAAWYTKYLFAAFEYGILPIVGQIGAEFHPDWPLLRGEAAAYIFNSLTVQYFEDREQIEEQQQQEAEQQQEDPAPNPDDLPEEDDNSMQVTFPFARSGKFNNKKPYSYLFTLSRSVIVSTEVSLQSGQTGMVSCRLYLLDAEGFSTEYYLGYQEGRSCYLMSALKPGNYQLQLQPTVADTTFDVVMEDGIGDGNDGFVQAVNIRGGQALTQVLTEDDFEDYFTFTVSGEQNKTVGVSSASKVRCLVYAMDDVDLFGFDGPECNQSYPYPSGTYYVSIGRKSPKSAKQTYTIQLR